MNRQRLLRAALCLAAAGLFGCDRDATPEETERFDPNRSAPPTGLIVRTDENLLQDQVTIARAMEKARQKAAPPAGTEPATGPSTAPAEAPAVAIGPPPTPPVVPPETPATAEAPVPAPAPAAPPVAPPVALPDVLPASAPVVPAPVPTEAPAPATAEAPTPPAVAEAPMDAIKKVIGRLMGLSVPGNLAKANLSDVFVDADVKVLQPFADGRKQVQEKSKTVEDTVRQKLGEDPAMMLSQMGEMGAMFNLPGMELGMMPPDQLQVKSEGNQVLLDDGGGRKYTFIRATPGAWRLQYSATDRAIAQALSMVPPAELKYLDAVLKGVNDGSITKDNFQEKMQQLHETHVVPAMRKYSEVMMKAMSPPR